jgi:hypothetical protein
MKIIKIDGLEDLKIWIWAITKSNFSQCQIYFNYPKINFLPKNYQIIIDYNIQLVIFVPHPVRSHWINRENLDFLPVFSTNYDDIPF